MDKQTGLEIEPVEMPPIALRNTVVMFTSGRSPDS